VFRDLYPSPHTGGPLKAKDKPDWMGVKGDESRLVRCRFCGFICDPDRDMQIKDGNFAGKGIDNGSRSSDTYRIPNTKGWMLSDNLVAYWKLDDNAASTTVLDAQGTYNGTATDNTEDLTATGKIDECFSFNGTDQGVNIGDSVVDCTTDFSFSGWVYCEGELAGDTDKYASAFGNGAWDAGGSAIEGLVVRCGQANEHFHFCVGNGTSYADVYLLRDIKTTRKQTWVHAVVTHKKATNTTYGYINAELVAEQVHECADPGNFKIGYSDLNTTENKWYGKIDNVMVFDTFLTAEHAAFLYNGGKGRTTVDRNTVTDYYYEPEVTGGCPFCGSHRYADK